MKKRILSFFMCFAIFSGISIFSTQSVYAHNAYKEIVGNGTNGIYIDIYSKLYSVTYANKTNAEYTSVGCTWFAGARACELTGIETPYVYTGQSWYNSVYANFGYTRGQTIRAKSLVCYTSHIAVVEQVNGDMVTISEGGSTYYSNEASGYCVIKTMSISELQSSRGGDWIGYVYLGNTYEDIGTNFYAMITHHASWNHLTAESNNNVDICYENYSVNQYWKFYRQNDGSYKIVSASTGKCLDVLNASTANGANIQVCGDNGLDAQRWYIYKCGNGYQLQAKCTQCVMEMNDWYFSQGVNVVSGTKDNSSAEIFAINKIDFNTVGKTTLKVNINNGICNFTWNNAKASTNYNIKVWNGDTVGAGEAPMNYWNVQNNSYKVNLGDGTFTAYIESYNAIEDYVKSSPISFSLNISEYTPVYSITFNNHIYSLYDTPISWEKAKTVTENSGGYLATITSQSEQEIITKLLEYGSLRGYSIGAVRSSEDLNEWCWVNGDKFEYYNWAPGEPNNTYGKEYYSCVYNIDSLRGQWNDSFNLPIEGICNGFIMEVDCTLGDVNNDGAVNVTDATEIQKYSAGKITFDDDALNRADVNSDGKVNVSDATLIQKYAVGLIDKF